MLIYLFVFRFKEVPVRPCELNSRGMEGPDEFVKVICSCQVLMLVD